MPARLLAYGGTSFSERRRIGPWPAIPEATLRDSYGLQPNAWCFGMGVLTGQPFLIFRQRQNVENRGGYPFSLLLDPGPDLWQRFEWNGAAVIAALLELNPDLLFKTPEACSVDALDALLSSLHPGHATALAGGLSYLIAATVTSSEPLSAAPTSLGFPERPSAAAVAGALAALPICFRSSGGYLVGGGSAHGRALGTNLVLDDQASSDPSPSAHIHAGKRLIDAWECARRRMLVQDLDLRPMWTWERSPADYLDAAALLVELETAESITDELLERSANARAFEESIEQLAGDLLTRGTAPLGPKASALLIGSCLQSKRKIDPRTASRLDPGTVLTLLRRQGYPPKKIPRSLPLPQSVRVGLWIDYLERLTADVRKNLADAIDQLGPNLEPPDRQELSRAALAALPASDEKLTDWNRFREDEAWWPLLEPALRDEALRRLRRDIKGAREAYLLFGGVIEEPPPQIAPPRPVEPPPNDDNRVDALRDSLEALLFETDRELVEARAEALKNSFEKLNSAPAKSALDAMVAARCAADGDQFGAAFSGKYLALGDAFQFLPEPAQDRLLECLESHQGKLFKAQVAIDLGHALKNKTSRNAYSTALSRYVLQHAELRKQVAQRMVEEVRDLERKLKSMLAKKDGRA